MPTSVPFDLRPRLARFAVHCLETRRPVWIDHLSAPAATLGTPGARVTAYLTMDVAGAGTVELTQDGLLIGMGLAVAEGALPCEADAEQLTASQVNTILNLACFRRIEFVHLG